MGAKLRRQRIVCNSKCGDTAHNHYHNHYHSLNDRYEWLDATEVSDG